jgi:hypothetical protein
MNVNINDSCMVKLTHAGYSVLKENNKIALQYNYDASNHELTIQLWDLMRTFGDQMFNGRLEPLFENNEITLLEEK